MWTYERRLEYACVIISITWKEYEQKVFYLKNENTGRRVEDILCGGFALLIAHDLCS